jgi:hypothetical protein
MLADGWLSPIDTARAKLQDQIGLFLSGRQKLLNLMSNPKLGIQGQAKGLYTVQTALEARLQNEITPLLAKVQAGTWDSSDILTIGGFTMQLMQQTGSVDSLERQAGGAPVSMFDMSPMTVMGIAGVVLAVGLFGGMLFGRRSQTQS